MRVWTNGMMFQVNYLFPENLFIIGTVNVDETTYMFSAQRCLIGQM